MKPILIALLAICLTTGCSKKEDQPIIEICLNTGSWLDGLVKELEPCTCKTNILFGVYENRPVYEVRGVDPLCNGINVVYNAAGERIITSAEKTAYDQYLSNVKEQRVLWSCDRGEK